MSNFGTRLGVSEDQKNFMQENFGLIFRSRLLAL